MEHMSVQAGDVLHFRQHESGEQVPLNDGLLAGDYLYRRVIGPALDGWHDGWYKTQGFDPDEGTLLMWDRRIISQWYIDHFAKKAMGT